MSADVYLGCISEQSRIEWTWRIRVSAKDVGGELGWERAAGSGDRSRGKAKKKERRGVCARVAVRTQFPVTASVILFFRPVSQLLALIPIRTARDEMDRVGVAQRGEGERDTRVPCESAARSTCAIAVESLENESR